VKSASRVSRGERAKKARKENGLLVRNENGTRSAGGSVSTMMKQARTAAATLMAAARWKESARARSDPTRAERAANHCPSRLVPRPTTRFAWACRAISLANCRVWRGTRSARARMIARPIMMPSGPMATRYSTKARTDGRTARLKRTAASPTGATSAIQRRPGGMDVKVILTPFPFCMANR
jgi:hypothetical protein